MILSLYFARRFLLTFGGLFVVFTVISGLIDMLEQIRKYGDQTQGMTDILLLTTLNLPRVIYQILPLITILATITLFLSLARSSELVVARAAGRSALRLLIAPLLAAFVIGVLAVAVMNPLVAATSKRYETMSNRYSQDASSVSSVTREGLWLRQGNAQGQVVIRATSSNLDGTRLFGATFMGFANDGQPTYRIEAESATLTQKEWQITNAKEWQLATSDNPERDAKIFAEMTLPSNLTPNQIRDSFGTPSAIAIWDLPAFIQNLERAGFSARIHRTWLQSELSLPIMMVAMVMIGAGFTMRHTRFGRTGLMVMLALLLGFSIYFIRNFAQIMGENGIVPIYLAVWAPPIAAILLTLGLLLHLEDG